MGERVGVDGVVSGKERDGWGGVGGRVGMDGVVLGEEWMWLCLGKSRCGWGGVGEGNNSEWLGW